MFRLFQTAAAFAVVYTCISYAAAATLTVDHRPTPFGIAYALSLDGSSVGNYNSFALRVYPDSPATFLNTIHCGVCDWAGEWYYRTYIDPFLEAPPRFGGAGLVLPLRTTTPLEVSFDAEAPGFDISDRVTYPLFLANVVLPTGATGTANIRLLDAGSEVFSQTIRFGIPEPSSLLLAVLGLAGCLARWRVYT